MKQVITSVRNRFSQQTRRGVPAFLPTHWHLSQTGLGSRASCTQTLWLRGSAPIVAERRKWSAWTLYGKNQLSDAKRPRMNLDGVMVEDEVDPGEIVGTSLRVLRYPHPLLRAKNATVSESEFDEDLKQLAREMLLIMYASHGVGLAAPQVGVNKRVLVFNPEGSSKAFLQEVVLVNPTIIASSKKTIVEPEACLSFPGMSGNVRRHEWVKVQAYRLNGKKFTVKYEGWKAKIFQHEFDHLQGVVYIDRLESEDKKEVQERLKQLVQDYKNSPYNNIPPAL